MDANVAGGTDSVVDVDSDAVIVTKADSDAAVVADAAARVGGGEAGGVEDEKSDAFVIDVDAARDGDAVAAADVGAEAEAVTSADADGAIGDIGDADGAEDTVIGVNAKVTCDSDAFVWAKAAAAGGGDGEAGADGEHEGVVVIEAASSVETTGDPDFDGASVTVTKADSYAAVFADAAALVGVEGVVMVGVTLAAMLSHVAVVMSSITDMEDRNSCCK